jgi:hypothetical protein
MGFHKHGAYSFSVSVQKMRVIGGDNFVADITALRHHHPSGVATLLDVPIIPEQYGETAQDAEGRAVSALGAWLDRHRPAPPEPRPVSRDASINEE